MSTNVSAPPQTAKWRPLAAIDRRVLGVLVEKAKTTPDQYPITLNGLCSGCNQKSNRFPQMEVKPEDVEDSLERLRLGAVTEIQGSGRVAKYRHLAYEWLGVEKLELAVMTELLLRGTQTEGDLRGRGADGPHPRHHRAAAGLQFAQAEGARHLTHARGAGPRRYARLVRAARAAKAAGRAQLLRQLDAARRHDLPLAGAARPR